MAMTNVTSDISPLSSLVTDEQYILIIQYTSDIGTVIAFMGVISNIINIRTFIAMGLNDGVTTSFLALAIFDLTYLLASLGLGVAVVFYVIEMKTSVRFDIEPYGVCVFFGNCMIMINVTNVLTTTFLAVARCMCVARPLQFKNTFTQRRAILFMTSFAMFAVVIYSPVVVNMRMINKLIKFTNTTRPSLWVTPQREIVKSIVWVVTDLAFPVVTQFIIIVCIFIMTKALREASRFRQSSVVSSETLSNKSAGNQSLTHKNTISDPYSSSNSVVKLTSKDLHVVQQVVLISAVYIVCNTPKILISVATTIEPEFTIGKSYSKLYMCANGLRKQFEILNAAVNLIIYFKYNSKFRSTLYKPVT